VRRLVLVRHGESVWNAEARIQGQACAGLSDIGHAQARAVCALLAVAHPDARLMVSDLQRCRETIAPLVAELGRDPDVDPALRERHYGAWEGRLRSEIAETEPDRWRRFGEGADVLPEVGGETAGGFADRVEETLSALLSATPDGETTVAVTHGGPIWHGTHRVVGLPPPALAGVHNTAVTELVRTGDGRILLDRWNEIGHLGLELRTRMGRRATGAAPVRQSSATP
jgi:glucosyl-3-phosphoglycerate phosphatase